MKRPLKRFQFETFKSEFKMFEGTWPELEQKLVLCEPAPSDRPFGSCRVKILDILVLILNWNTSDMLDDWGVLGTRECYRANRLKCDGPISEMNFGSAFYTAILTMSKLTITLTIAMILETLIYIAILEIDPSLEELRRKASGCRTGQSNGGSIVNGELLMVTIYIIADRGQIK